jgi:hypothetical protein
MIAYERKDVSSTFAETSTQVVSIKKTSKFSSEDITVKGMV